MIYRIVYIDHVARFVGGEFVLVRALTTLGSRVDAHVILGEQGPRLSAPSARDRGLRQCGVLSPVRSTPRQGGAFTHRRMKRALCLP